MTYSGDTVAMPWPLDVRDQIVLKVGVRLEDTDRWTPEADRALTGGNYVGWATNAARRALPWGAGNVLRLAVEGSRRRAFFIAGAMNGHDPMLGGDWRLRDLQGAVRLPARGTSVVGLAPCPDGRSLACIESGGIAPGALTIIDLASGTRRVVTRLDSLRGDEVPLWSPDGRWIIVPGSPPRLVGVEKHVMLDLNLGNHGWLTQIDWWPQRGASPVFALVGEGLRQEIRALDLATGAEDFLAMAMVPRQADLEPSRHFMTYPRMSPTGDAVAVGCRLGPTGAYQEQYGSRDRLALLDPNTGQLLQPYDPFVDGGVVEREHSYWSWIGRESPPPDVVTVSPELLAGARPLDQTDMEEIDSSGFVESVWMWSA